MKLINKIELVPGFREKLDAVTVLNVEIPEHQSFYAAIKDEIVETSEVAELLKGREYFVRIKPIEVEILVK
jgi:hypothetical protein